MKSIVITGISRGIGKALAIKFLDEGYKVYGTSKDGSIDFDVQKRHNLKVIALDLSNPKSIKDCASYILKSGDKIDVLINNAGILADEDDTHLIPEKLRKTLEVNLIGTADLTEAMIPFMNMTGHIVFVSSSAGSITDMDNILDSHYPYHYPAYKISKAALNMYVRTLAVRMVHEDKGITISAVHPGWVRTAIGGDEAPISPEEAADDIFKLAISKPENGQFWFKDKKFPW